MSLQELRARIANIITEANLPLEVIDMLMENIYLSVHQQLELAMAQKAAEEAKKPAPAKEDKK